MPDRGIYRGASQRGYGTPTNAPLRVDSTSNLVMVNPNGVSSGASNVELPLAFGLTVSGARMAAGTGTLVSGAVVIATGLTSVLGFSANLSSTGTTATGATEVCFLFVSSITTGAVTVQGAYQTSADFTQASVSGTGVFYWTAIGV